MIPFIKMHGLGNDFVVIDERGAPMQLVEAERRAEMVCALAARRTGIGCDQLIVLRPTRRADVYMQIYNADGSEVSACGNATRCVAWLLLREGHKDACLIETESALLECYLAGREKVRVNMGLPGLSWQDIPLSHEADTLHLPLRAGSLNDAVAVSIGNPHAIFFVDGEAAIDLAGIGPEIEHHALFPDRVNVSVAEIVSAGELRMRTWERGAGETLACGTGACAAVVAGRRRGLLDPLVLVHLPGGELKIEWQGGEADPAHPVWMTGGVTESFRGELSGAAWI